MGCLVPHPVRGYADQVVQPAGVHCSGQCEILLPAVTHTTWLTSYANSPQRSPALPCPPFSSSPIEFVPTVVHHPHYLFAESFDVSLRQLLALHQVLDPAFDIANIGKTHTGQI